MIKAGCEVLIRTMALLILSGCSTLSSKDVPTVSCFDRQQNPHTTIVDSHIHFRPFGGPAIPWPTLNEFFNKTGVRYATVYGIGQTLPYRLDCNYYQDAGCTDKKVTPGIRNDFANASNNLDYNGMKGVELVLSMTFPDLAQPEKLVDTLNLYDKEFPGAFKFAGEVNLVKQALFGHRHKPASFENIDGWTEFMAILAERQIPINIHSDLGNNKNPKKYLPLMEYAVKSYPNNKIVWAHMGLSKELTTMPAQAHISEMSRMLDTYPNLYLDISWRVLEDYYFKSHQSDYVAFLNTYSARILTGTDFVAASTKTYQIYLQELKQISSINQYLNDKAFRDIALGGSYFSLLNINEVPPEICTATEEIS